MNTALVQLLPELTLVALAFAVICRDLLVGREGRNASSLLCIGGLLAVFLLLFLPSSQEEALILGAYRLHGLATLFKMLFTLSALFVVLLARSYFTPGGSQRGALGYGPEFHLLVIAATAGMFVVVSAVDLLTLFIGMELATIPLYVLSGWKQDDAGVEASAKFIILGSLSTGLMLFGLSYLFGFAGGLGYDALQAAAARMPVHPLLQMGVLFLLAGLGFKLTMVPFHMWAPDVYEGAPTPITAFLSVSSKATAVGLLLVLVTGPLAAVQEMIAPLFLVLAAITMTIGNLGAMRQRNLRRFMAYSSIAQAGYILMALAGSASAARTAIAYYLPVYAAANYAVFFLIAIVSREREETIEGLRGLGRTNPGLAAVLMLAMFSLAGIPPLAGFTGKFLLFAAVAKEGYYFMVVFAALNSTISLYYYLLLIREAYITPSDEQSAPLTTTITQRSSLLPLTLAMIALGIIPAFGSAVMQLIH